MFRTESPIRPLRRSGASAVFFGVVVGAVLGMALVAGVEGLAAWAYREEVKALRETSCPQVRVSSNTRTFAHG